MKFDKEYLRTLIVKHKKGRREAWPSNEYIYMVEGRTISSKDWVARSASQELTPTEIEEGLVKIDSHIDMHGANGVRIIGWHPTKEDLSAEDWIFIE